MSKRAWLGLILIVISLLPRIFSFGGPLAATSEAPHPERDPNPDNALYAETSFAALLDRPRAELAALAEQWSERVALQQVLYHQGKLPFYLLPDARLPVVAPVFRQAKLSAKVGFSLPPYHPGETPDAGLALHLARHGDSEAARRLTDPADVAARARIDVLRLGRNYPLEWTRLVGLVFQHAEVGLAHGNEGAAVALGKLHQQLLQVLDEKAQQGPLGAALLGRGRAVLGQAAAAWRKNGSDALAQQAEAALAAWGPVPSLRPGLTPGDTQAETAQLLGSSGTGRALTAASAARALDVLGLPIPDDGAEAVVAFLDGADRLTEVLVAYRPGLAAAYAQPAQLGQRLEDHGPGEDRSGDLPRRQYRAGPSTCEVVIVPRNPWAGAFVRLSRDAANATAATLPRDLGLAHLDRSFDENRLHLAPGQAGDKLRLTDVKVLAGLRLPLPAGQVSEAVLARDTSQGATAAGTDVVRDLTASVAIAETRQSLPALAQALWQTGGPARITAAGDKDARHLALTWEDAQTRYVLRLPNGPEDGPELEVGDRPGALTVAERAKRARAWDRAERQARLKEGKPLARLPRELERLRLGLPSDELLALMPAGENVVKRDLPDGALVTVLGAPGASGAQVRQVFVRFDQSGHAAELHTRYTDTPASKGATQKLLEAVRVRAGAAREAAVAADPGTRKPVGKRYDWHDDVTTVTCVQEGGGLEVILRDRQPEQDADALRPARYLPPGVEGCTLGLSRDALLRTWDVREAGPAGGPVALTPKRSSLYDALFVWLENDRVVTILARHKQGTEEPLQAAAAGQAVVEAWSRDAAALGWPRRQGLTATGAIQSWANHDDFTRVRIFWQVRHGEAPQVFTEWRLLASR
jgi:hypothetical protein